jgi:acyl-[acyl-carrier-protein]-phospholipid O-acyltransferase/long-chain-fatty-acid--[acyl-carrier-protein] ligase
VQVAAVIDISPDWVLFNPLPMFHAFGLVGTMLPLFSGMKAFLYPSPLHTKMVVDLVRESGATVLIATDTFMGQYARAADPADFAGLQIVVCGAEKVRDSTRSMIAEKFGAHVHLLEGYGATECSPVIAVNPPHDNRPHTVGALMPEIETRFVAVDGIPEGGRLYVRGPNVMSGYLDASGLEPPEDGWHDTGDIAALEPDGYLRLLGRVKRFAKIGGEMISLSAVEDLAAGLWPDGWRAVVSVADKKKGEKLVLVTDVASASAQALLAHAQLLGAPDLAVPRKVIKVGAPILLGTGKTDYAAVQRIALAES